MRNYSWGLALFYLPGINKYQCASYPKLVLQTGNGLVVDGCENFSFHLSAWIGGYSKQVALFQSIEGLAGTSVL